MAEFHEKPAVRPGCKVILKDGRCVAVHDRMDDLIHVKTGRIQSWETHVNKVEKIDEEDAFEPDRSWF